MTERIIYILFTVFIFTFQSHAQNKKVLDSLQLIYQIAKQDTTKISTLLSIATIYSKSKPDTSSITFAQEALTRSQKIGFQIGIAHSIFLIGKWHYGKSNTYLALEYLQKSLKMSEEIKYREGISLNSSILGNIYFTQGNYPLALGYYLRILKIKEDIKDKSGMSIMLNNIGNVHKNQQNYDLALEYYQKSLKIKQDIQEKAGIGVSFNNIGNIYIQQGNYDLASEYHQKSLKIKEELKDKKGIAASLNNIAQIYTYQENYPLALEYYEKALKMKEEIKDIFGIVSSLNGIATVYINQKEYDKSIAYAERGLQLAKEGNFLQEIGVLSYTLYENYRFKGDYNKSLEYHVLHKKSNDSLFNVEKAKSVANLESKVVLEKKEKEIILLAKDNELNKLNAERQARELEIAKKQAEAEHLLSLAQTEKDKHKQDSLLNLAQKSQLETENLRTKEEKLKLEQEKQSLAHKAELETQKRIQNTFWGIIATFLIIIGLVFIGYKQKQKSNMLLTKQNEEIKQQQLEIIVKNAELGEANEVLSQQKEELGSLNEHLEFQKQEIEETYAKLKATSDTLGKSISYASHIQEIILADTKTLNLFFSDLFIIYKPKDVVSGDFYWFSQINEQESVFVLADCTGHGVPGAFMSMLGCTLLHETVNVKGIYNDPAHILQNLHTTLRKILKQATSNNSDGMDIGVCYFATNVTSLSTKLIFAGAKTAMYYVENGCFHIINGDRVYLGGKKEEAAFQNKEVEVSKGSSYYFSSDGFGDQNNIERKKFGSKPLQELLFSISGLPMSMQKDILLKTLDTHQGDELQRDDISVVGLKI